MRLRPLLLSFIGPFRPAIAPNLLSLSFKLAFKHHDLTVPARAGEQLWLQSWVCFWLRSWASLKMTEGTEAFLRFSQSRRRPYKPNFSREFGIFGENLLL